MARILVLYYSMYGHIRTMARTVVEGAREVDGVEVDLRRVPETMPTEVLEQLGALTDDDTPVAAPGDLPDYDGLILGTPTRFGNMTGQMRTFFDQTGSLWFNGTLIGKVGSVFTSTATGGGNETTITSVWNTLAHHGYVIVGLPYSCPELTDISEVKSGGPYGAATIAAPDGSRQPSDKELAQARFQGSHVADITRRLHG